MRMRLGLVVSAVELANTGFPQAARIGCCVASAARGLVSKVNVTRCPDQRLRSTAWAIHWLD